MRRNRTHIGPHGSGRRFKYDWVILKPIHSQTSNVNLVVQNFLYPNYYMNRIESYDTVASNSTNRYFFGGLNYGPQSIYKISINLKGTAVKTTDKLYRYFVIKGITTDFGDIANHDIFLLWDLQMNLYGNWKVNDFASKVPDYINGPFLQLTAPVNAKTAEISAIQITLYGT